MGVRGGRWCIGGSWALMVALFALGAMSLTQMGLVAALVVFEKLALWPRAASVATALVLVALAVGIVVSPHEVPGLVVPGSHAACMP
jgi:predicted metal-binding membrane protein